MRVLRTSLCIFLLALFVCVPVVRTAEETAEHSSAAEEHSSTAEPAGEGHAEEHHETWWQIAAKWINFLLLVGILYFFMRRSLKIQDRFRGDYEAIKTSIESARQAKDEAERKLQELDQKLSGMNQEIERIKAEAAKEADEERRRILEAAQKEAERIVEMAHREIDIEVELARRTLRKQVADSSVSESRKIIETEMNERDQKRLLEEYIKEFGK